MPGFAQTLTDRQIATLGAYLTQRYGNPAAVISADQVKTLRAGGAPTHLVVLARLALIVIVLVLVAIIVMLVRRKRRTVRQDARLARQHAAARIDGF